MLHDFFLAKKNEFTDPEKEFNKLYDENKKNKYIIYIDDEIVLNNPLFLKGFKSFKCYFKNLSEGLDYYGITILPTESLEKFIKNIEQVKCKPKYKEQLKELIELCRKAIEEDKYVVHFGI